MSKISKIPKIYNALFLLLLFVPLLFVDLQGGGVSNLENRNLAKRPALSLALESPKAFIAAFDSWFSDNVGFRRNLLRIHRAFNTLERLGATYLWGSIGGTHYMDGTSIVFIGKEGHHFHTHYGQTLAAYQGKPWLTEEQLRGVAEQLDAAKAKLDARGIPLVVMLCADKESIYPEFYPTSIVRAPEPTPLDAVANYLSEHTEVDFFCVKERLLREKENYLVFPKTGTFWELCHFNETGSFFAYQELMEHARAYLPGLSPFTMDDVNIAYRDSGSSTVTFKEALTFKKIAPRFFPDALEWENSDPTLPTALLLCDSYSDHIRNYLPRNFGRTILHHWSTFDRLDEYIDAYKPDIVLMEVAERGFPGLPDALLK